METWQVTLVIGLVSVIMWLGGMLYSSRNPQNLASVVNNQQNTIILLQKRVDELELMVNPTHVRVTTDVIFDENGAHVESSKAERILYNEPTNGGNPPTHPKTRPRAGFGGMKERKA